MRVENREWMRVRGDNNCVSADQYALAGSISAVPVRSSDEQLKPKPIANSESGGASAVTPVMTHSQTEHFSLQNSWRVTDTFAKGKRDKTRVRLNATAVPLRQRNDHFRDLPACKSEELSQC